MGNPDRYTLRAELVEQICSSTSDYLEMLVTVGGFSLEEAVEIAENAEAKLINGGKPDPGLVQNYTSIYNNNKEA